MNRVVFLRFWSCILQQAACCKSSKKVENFPGDRIWWTIQLGEISNRFVLKSLFTQPRSHKINCILVIFYYKIIDHVTKYVILSQRSNRCMNFFLFWYTSLKQYYLSFHRAKTSLEFCFSHNSSSKFQLKKETLLGEHTLIAV